MYFISFLVFDPSPNKHRIKVNIERTNNEALIGLSDKKKVDYESIDIVHEEQDTTTSVSKDKKIWNIYVFYTCLGMSTLDYQINVHVHLFIFQKNGPNLPYATLLDSNNQ